MWLFALLEVAPETWLTVRTRREGRSRSLADILMSTVQIPTRYTILYIGLASLLSPLIPYASIYLYLACTRIIINKQKSLGTQTVVDCLLNSTEQLQCSPLCWTKPFLLIIISSKCGAKLAHMVFFQIIIKFIIKYHKFCGFETIELNRFFNVVLTVRNVNLVLLS